MKIAMPQFKTFIGACLATAVFIGSYSQAKVIPQIRLGVDLATPVMEADLRQTAFVKISLAGFKLEEAHSQRAPTNIALVLDRSGSMAGDNISRAKEAAIMAVDLLNKDDIVSILAYDDTVNVVVPATKVSDKKAIQALIRRIDTGGSTALFAGVSKGADELRKFIDRNRVNRVILLSDGLANVGPQSPRELGQLGLSFAKEGISVTTIGLGLGYNEDLMTQLAGYSDGNHAFVENPQDLAKIFKLEFGDVLSVIAQEINIEIQCADGIKPLRLLGREAEIIGSKVHTRLNQLYSEQEKYLVLEVEVPASQAGKKRNIATVNLTYSDIRSQKMMAFSHSASANFSKSKGDVIAGINKDAYEDSVEQVANETSKEAIILRDKGDVVGAQNLLKSNAAYLSNQSTLIESKKLEEQSQETVVEAEQIDDDNEWNKNRKQSKERTYKRSKQQAY